LRTGQRFGAEHLIAVLRGEATEKVRQHRHDRLPTFGVGADTSKALWRSYLRQLAATDVLRIDIGRYGALKLGSRARAVLNGVESVGGGGGRPPRPPRRRRGRARGRPRQNPTSTCGVRVGGG
ncbi:MAG: hypothetical protein F4X97_09525, partial [Boseongicola sp. SB0662_bin_57]|nr:hypothetical protein [Boseongicola sp. SB0662_bin_57]